MKQLSISVFFPCYNDEHTIGRLILQTYKLLTKLRANFEILVIDDGSTDQSREKVAEIAAKFPKIKLIRHRRNLGYGAVLQTGLRKASKALVFYTDGDGQYNVLDLPILLSCLTADIDIVNGIKMERQDEDLRILLGNAYKSAVRNLFNVPVYDPDCDFRLVRKKSLRGVSLHCQSGAACVELVKKLQLNGARFREVTVRHHERLFGQSQFFKVKPLLAMAYEIVKLWFDLNLKTRSHQPGFFASPSRQLLSWAF